MAVAFPAFCIAVTVARGYCGVGGQQGTSKGRCEPLEQGLE